MYKRQFRNAPRVVDIDLLVMEGVRMEEEELTLPHPRMAERAFVLMPLEALYPDGLVLGFEFSENMKQIQREGEMCIRDRLFLCGYRRMAWTGRLWTDIENVRSFRFQLQCPSHSPIRMQVPAAVGEAVRRDIQDAHDRRIGC